MTVEEKSDQLIKQFIPIVQGWDCYNDSPRNPDDVMRDAKQCASIVACEVIAVTEMYKGNINPNWIFWQEVRNEVEKKMIK